MGKCWTWRIWPSYKKVWTPPAWTLPGTVTKHKHLLWFIHLCSDTLHFLLLQSSTISPCHLVAVIWRNVNIHSIPSTQRPTAQGPTGQKSNELWAQFHIKADKDIQSNFRQHLKHCHRRKLIVAHSSEKFDSFWIGYKIALSRLSDDRPGVPGISDKRCHKKGMPAVATRRVGRGGIDGVVLKAEPTPSQTASILNVLTSRRGKNDKVSRLPETKRSSRFTPSLVSEDESRQDYRICVRHGSSSAHETAKRNKLD